MTPTYPIRHPWLCSLLFWIAFVSGCAGPNEAPSTAQQQQPQRTQALVSLSETGVTVKNFGSAPLPDVILLINVKRTDVKPVQTAVGNIPAGRSVDVSYADFTDLDGKRFDAMKTRIYTVAVQTPIETGGDGYKLFVCPTNVCQPAGP